MVLVSPTSLRQPTASDCEEAFSSPLLREVAARFDDPKRHVILDLGVANQGILELLQGKRCRLLVADAAMSLSALEEQNPEADSLAEEMAALIADAGKEKIDTVLCWDLLNYLSLPLVQAFTTRLASIMVPGGIVHAYIHSASAAMPQFPQRYSLSGEDRVVRLGRGPDSRKTPRYSFGDLEKYAAGFRVDRSMLLRNGIQEYLLRLNPEQSRSG